MSGAIDRNKPIEVIMTAEQWQLVMQMIGQSQYVGTLMIETIQRQCMSHVEPMREPAR